MSTSYSPVRIAHVIGKLNAAGVEAVVNNYYRHIDHTKYQFDFIIDSDSNFSPRQDLIDLGARYYIVPPYQKLFSYMKELIKLFRKNHYRIVHSSMNTLSVFSLCAALIAGVPVRINHSHSTAAKGETKKNLLKYALRPFAKLFATHLCACSNLAGEWLFGKQAMKQGKVTIFNNAIDIRKFAFDPQVRSEMRKELELENAFIIGHVGRFCFQKNQEFLIDIFSKFRELNPKAVLLLVGIGETMEMIRDKVRQARLDNAVIFTGARNDVELLYQAMDVFVLPSHYEGLPVVGVEAQCAGLPVLFSEKITKEAKISDHVQYLPISEPNAWVEALANLPGFDRNTRIAAKYDITYEANKLQDFYDQALIDYQTIF